AALGTMFVMYFSENMVALDTFDFWVGTLLIFVLAMLQTFLYGWVLGIEQGEKELHEGAHIRVPRAVQYLLKYIVPLYLLVIFIAYCIQDAPEYAKKVAAEPAVQLSIVFLGIVAFFLLL